MKLSRDAWTGLVVLATSLFLFALTLGLKDSPLVPIGPGFYPRIVLGLTAVLAAALLAFALWEKAPAAASDGKAVNRAMVFLVFLVFGVYAGALPFLGYRLATFFFVAGLQALLEPPKGIRGWLIVAGSALVTTAITYYVFEHYLSVLLPRGRLSGF